MENRKELIQSFDSERCTHHRPTAHLDLGLNAEEGADSAFRNLKQGKRSSEPRKRFRLALSRQAQRRCKSALTGGLRAASAHLCATQLDSCPWLSQSGQKYLNRVQWVAAIPEVLPLECAEGKPGRTGGDGSTSDGMTQLGTLHETSAICACHLRDLRRTPLLVS